jgi:hypothetical protein
MADSFVVLNKYYFVALIEHNIQIERSVSLILGILGNLAHFRHSFIKLTQNVIKNVT